MSPKVFAPRIKVFIKATD